MNFAYKAQYCETSAEEQFSGIGGYNLGPGFVAENDAGGVHTDLDAVHCCTAVPPGATSWIPVVKIVDLHTVEDFYFLHIQG